MEGILVEVCVRACMCVCVYVCVRACMCACVCVHILSCALWISACARERRCVVGCARAQAVVDIESCASDAIPLMCV